MGFKMVKRILFKKPNNKLLIDIEQAVKELGGWGSVEVYVQNGKVTQITKRVIKKTNFKIKK